MKYTKINTEKISPLGIPCKKAIYHSREEALDMIKYINEQRITKAIKPYKCSVCGFWHLTSKTV
jgi:hypothetical protein